MGKMKATPASPSRPLIMNDSTRFLFAALCFLGLTAILSGAAWEWRRQKRGATISARHFRWRMVSALLWTLILGSLGWATLFSWPASRQDVVTAQRFGAVLAGAMMLMMVAFVLMIFDFYLTAKTRQIQTARMQHDLGEIARREIERAQSEAQRAQDEKTS